MNLRTSTPFATPDDFQNAVLRLRPTLAVFDCDGTLWSMDSGEGFMNWELELGLLPPEVALWIRDRYRQYRAGRVPEEVMCGEMVTIHSGLPLARLEQAAAEFFDKRVAPLIFPELFSLASKLAQSGCEMWAVSSTNDWVVRAGVARFSIPVDHVLAACIHFEDGVATDRLIRVPSGPDKAVAVREVIGRTPDVAFGNSIHDLELLECARQPFVVNPNPDLKMLAEKRGWPVYAPELPTVSEFMPSAEREP